MTGRGLLSQLHPRHIRWWQWLLLTFVGLFFFLRSWLPEFLRQQILAQLVAATPAHVQLRNVDLDLLNGRVMLQDLSFLLEGDSQPALVIDDLTTKVSLRALLRREISLDDVHLSGVQVHAVHEVNGQLNLTRLFLPSPSEPEQPPSDLPMFIIQRIAVSDSQCTYRDRAVTPEVHLTLAVATLQATQVTLQANGLSTPVEVQLKGTLNNSPLDGKADVFWQREQTKIDARVEAKQLALAVIEPYLRDVLTVQILTGQVGTNIQYHFHSGTASPRHSLAGTIDVDHLQFVEAGLEQSVITLSEGHVAVETLDFLAHHVRVKSIEMKDPKLSLVQSDKGLNVASWVRPTQAETAPTSSQKSDSPSWSYVAPTVKWIGGEITYRDNAWPEKEKLLLQPEEIIASSLASGMKELPFQFRTRAGEGKVAGDGRLQFAPFNLQLSLQPTDLEIATLQPLLTPVLAAKKIQGKVTGKLYADISDQDGTRVTRTHGVVVTQNFTLHDTPEQGETIGWQKGTIEIGEGSTLIPFSLHLKPDLSHVALKRATHNDLMIEQVTGETRLAQATAGDGQLQIKIVGILDTGKLALTGVPETANVLSWDNGHLDFQEGSTLVPLALKLKTQVAQLSLRQLPHGDVTIEKASSELHLTQEVDAQQASVLKVQGPVEFTSFALTHSEEKQVLLGCYHGKATMSEGSRLLPLDIKLRDVALEYTYAQGMRPPTGRFQLFIPTSKERPVNVFPTAPEQIATPTAPEASPSIAGQQPPPLPSETSAATVSIQIDRATIIGGQLYFEDRTVSPPQTVYWQDVRIDLNHLDFPVLLPGVFSAFAYNEDGAPVEFKGRTERQGQQTVVRVHGKVEKMALSRFNSYLEPSLGYRVKKGAVSATWDLVLPGDRLQANMKVTLHDINLGGKQKASNLEQQVGLPLALVIALLKDLNGDISLQLPVEGRVNDPGFEWSGTVVRAVRDVIIGAVTSPLKVLGALFKGKDTLEGFSLDPVRFVPGTTQIAESGKEQLSRLTVFLSQRPMIDLRFSGATGPEDTEILRTQEMLRQLPATSTASEKAGDTQQVTPQEEVRKVLTEIPPTQGNRSVAALSPQATALLAQLRKQTKVTAEMAEQLAQERVRAVLSELTIRHAVAADRLHISPEKQRGAGSAEVRYTIQTRESSQ